MAKKLALEDFVNSSKIVLVADQLKQYYNEKKYFSHYLQNVVRIVFNIPVIDYRLISHENHLVHSEYSSRKIF